jgi:hypothetical protein
VDCRCRTTTYSGSREENGLKIFRKCARDEERIAASVKSSWWSPTLLNPYVR